MKMTKDRMTECEKNWGGETALLYNAEWVRRLDVLLAMRGYHDTLSSSDDFKVCAATPSRLSNKRLRKIQECFDGKYDIHAPYIRVTHAHALHGGWGNMPRAWCCPSKGYNQKDSMCPFCKEDYRNRFASDKLRYDGPADEVYWNGVPKADESLAKSWGDLNLVTVWHDFNDPATQEQSHDCAVFARRRCSLPQHANDAAGRQMGHLLHGSRGRAIRQG
jgi:hypothetical protein